MTADSTTQPTDAATPKAPATKPAKTQVTAADGSGTGTALIELYELP